MSYDPPSVIVALAGGTEHFGTALLDFGSDPNSSASVYVSGQTGLLTTSKVRISITGVSTADNTIQDHLTLAANSRLTAGNMIANTGFTIYAESQYGIYTGKYQVNWVWR